MNTNEHEFAEGNTAKPKTAKPKTGKFKTGKSGLDVDEQILTDKAGFWRTLLPG